MAGCSTWFYMGIDNSLSEMARRYSNTAAVSALVARALELIQRPHIRAWYSRAPSKLNTADLPTRGEKLPFRTAQHSGFRSLSKLYRIWRVVARLQPHLAKSRAPRMQIRPLSIEGNSYTTRRRDGSKWHRTAAVLKGVRIDAYLPIAPFLLSIWI